MNKIKMKYISVSQLFGFVILLISVACQSDKLAEFDGKPWDVVSFDARLENTASVMSRVPSEDSSVYIAEKPYDMDFYIQLASADDTNNPVSNFGTYVVASGYEGKLVEKNNSLPLIWQSLRGEHTFYGWTFPFGDNSEFYDRNPYLNFNKLDPSEPVPSARIKFQDSPEGDETYSKYKNNSIYETFIGVKKGPVTYMKNGTYVPLIFRHLVSKIFVEELILNQSGSIQEHLQANVTFYGMPKTATFIPRPDGDMPPVVVPDEATVDDELTFFISNTSKKDDYLYICPEIDFSKVSFSIKLTSTEEEFNGMREYSGNFSNVFFDRTGVNWDNLNPDGSWKADDSTILHAGEMMIIRIILYPGGGGGLFIKIVPWSTQDPKESTHHSRPGIYNNSSLSEIIKAAKDNINDIFALYGQGDNIFNLYENVTLSESNLVIPDDYILEGNGHLITVSKSPVEVKNVRNVYLSDGKNTIYIDAEGDIYLVDNNFVFPPDPDKATGKLKSSGNSKIDFSKGTVS